MTNKTMLKILDLMVTEEKSEYIRKGADYAVESDCLNNFKQTGQELGITPLQVWFIFFKKHVDAIASYCGGKKLQTEDIRSRIKDGRVYLALLRGIVEEETSEERDSLDPDVLTRRWEKQLEEEVGIDD